MTNKDILFRNLINHETFNIQRKLQDLQQNFRVLFGTSFHLDKYNLFDAQLNLLRAHIDKLIQISSKLSSNDIDITEEKL
jgi:hypothetical protein